MSYNGITLASQAKDVGSIPITRSTRLVTIICYFPVIPVSPGYWWHYKESSLAADETDNTGRPVDIAVDTRRVDTGIGYDRLTFC